MSFWNVYNLLSIYSLSNSWLQLRSLLQVFKPENNKQLLLQHRIIRLSSKIIQAPTVVVSFSLVAQNVQIRRHFTSYLKHLSLSWLSSDLIQARTNKFVCIVLQGLSLLQMLYTSVDSVLMLLHEGQVAN